MSRAASKKSSTWLGDLAARLHHKVMLGWQLQMFCDCLCAFIRQCIVVCFQNLNNVQDSTKTLPLVTRVLSWIGVPRPPTLTGFCSPPTSWPAGWNPNPNWPFQPPSGLGPTSSQGCCSGFGAKLYGLKQNLLYSLAENPESHSPEGGSKMTGVNSCTLEGCPETSAGQASFGNPSLDAPNNSGVQNYLHCHFPSLKKGNHNL